MRIRGLFHWSSRACFLRVLFTTSSACFFLSLSALAATAVPGGGVEQEEVLLTRSPMVAIATEAWALAGCGAASKVAAAVVQELPVQQHPPAAAGRAKFRGVSSNAGQDRREAAVVVSRRSGLASCVLAALAASFSPLAADRPARAMVLEEDDDIELLERVKEDRKKRLEKQGIISASGKETGQSVSESFSHAVLLL